MMRDLILAGRELAGYSDPRVQRGLWWSMAEALFSTVPYALVAWLLLDLMQARLDGLRIVLLACAMLLSMVARVICGRRAMPSIFSGAYAMMGQARLRVADHLRRLPLGWWGQRRSGSLAATLSADLQLIEDLWAHFLGVFFGGLMAPLMLSTLLLWLDWRLGLVVLLSLVCAALLVGLAQQVLAAQSHKLHAANAHGQDELLDYVRGIAVIRSFESGAEANGRLARLQKALAAMRRRALVIELAPTPLIGLYGFAIEAGFAFAVWFGAQRLGSSLPGTTLLLFAVLSLPVYRQLFDVGIAFLLLRYARQALLRIRALLDAQAMPEPVVPQTISRHDIELDDVYFRYEGQRDQAALEAINARLPAGSLTAIVGRSGAGKSTLLHVMARLWDVERGAVRIGGVDVRAAGSEALQASLGVVFQDVVLFSGTVAENIGIGRPGASRSDIERAAQQAEAHAFISALPQGYDTQIGENGSRLSGGERQRLSIARAFLKDAPILLLDEATASIDPSCAAQIQRAMGRLLGKRTVVVIAHRLRSVRYADHILVMDKGRIAEQGAHEQLLAHGGIYAQLWEQEAAARNWTIGKQ